MDSKDILDAMLGRAEQVRRKLFKESMLGIMSTRKGHLKYIAPVSASKKILDRLAEKEIDSGFSPEPQLYNLLVDIFETSNIAAGHLIEVAQMQARIDSFISYKDL